jgi:hypothetical protein
MIASTTAYPLSWPNGVNRNRNPCRSRFKANFGRARDELVTSLKRMNAKNVVISTNIPLKNDGLPYANFRPPDDKGVAVYFQYNGRPMVFACDNYLKIEDNLWAICKTIEAIRGIERWGSSEMLERAFSGFAQLEAPSDAIDPQRQWWQILGFGHTEEVTVEKLKSTFNALAKKHHPDVGGSEAEFIRIKKAYDAGLQNFGLKNLN